MAEISNASESNLVDTLAEVDLPIFPTNDPPGGTQLAENADNCHITHTLREANLELQLVIEAQTHRLSLDPQKMDVVDHPGLDDGLSSPIRPWPTELLSAIFTSGTARGHSRTSVGIGALADKFLRRSGGHPLTIDFGCFEREPAQTELNSASGSTRARGWMLPLISTAKRSSARFSHAVASGKWPHFTLCSIYNVPLLEKLTLRISRPALRPLNDKDTFRSCPRLIELTLSLALPSREYIEFPWHQLIRYTGDKNLNEDIDAGAHGRVTLERQLGLELTIELALNSLRSFLGPTYYRLP
ncbi:hypothetical protein C8R43DRAFT_1111948 [Mycena crocata]|nr:hypothetical protein C8R43DRAFT_1111948 [Mycena crocata]